MPIGKIDQPRLTPVASPVSAFVKTTAGQGLKDLAGALSDLAPNLQRFADSQIEDEKKKGSAKAISLFEEVQETGKQIKAGEIAPHESKWFRLAAREQYGRLSAAKFAGDLQAAITSDPNLKESTSAKDFDAFEANFRKQWLTEHVGEDADPALDAGFGPRAEESMLNIRNGWIEQAGKRLENGVLEATYQEHQVTISELMQKGASWEQIGDALKIRNGGLYMANPKSGIGLTNSTLKAVIDVAVAERNTEILKILDYVPGGTPGSVLGKTSKARAMVEAATDNIRADRMSENNLAAQEDKKAANDAVDTVFDSLYDAMDKAGKDNLSSVDVVEYAKALQRNPLIKQEDIQRLYAAYNSYAKASDHDDDPVANGLWQRAFNGTLRSTDISEAFEHGSIKVDTARRMRSEIGAKRAGRAAKALTEEPRFKDAESALRQLFIDQYGINKFEAKFRADQAVWQLKRDWVTFRRSEKGQGAADDDTALNDWLQAANWSNFSKFADADTRAKLAGLPVADRPPAGSGPALVQWQEGKVISPSDLTQLASEVGAVRGRKRARFSPAAEELLRRNGINTLDEAQKFLDRQREFVSLNDLR
jgi:hypothetical protein